jgi:hypothetical protein
VVLNTRTVAVICTQGLESVETPPGIIFKHDLSSHSQVKINPSPMRPQVWGAAVLIMTALYTANMVSSMTAERLQSPLASVDDLVSRNYR